MLDQLGFDLGTSEIVMVGFALLILLILVPFTIIDSVRSPHLTIIQKFAWIVFIIIAPYLGAVVYLWWGRRQKIV